RGGRVPPHRAAPPCRNGELGGGHSCGLGGRPAARRADRNVNRSGFGQGFDQASRTVHMPKATIPMLSPGTAEATRRAVEVYDGIVARGGSPGVSKVLESRLAPPITGSACGPGRLSP